MPADLPKYLTDEEDFARFCEARGFDETAAAWVLFEQWVDGDLDDFPDPEPRESGDDFGDVYVPDDREPF